MVVSVFLGEWMYPKNSKNKLNPWGFDLFRGIATTQPKDLPPRCWHVCSWCPLASCPSEVNVEMLSQWSCSHEGGFAGYLSLNLVFSWAVYCTEAVWEKRGTSPSCAFWPDFPHNLSQLSSLWQEEKFLFVVLLEKNTELTSYNCPIYNKCILRHMGFMCWWI